MSGTPARDASRKFGDFTGLAANYSKFRPAYCPAVLELILNFTGKPAPTIFAADLGAGTGLWTRMLARAGVEKLVAIEPNDDMRAHGQADSRDSSIRWMNGSGESTGLPAGELDLVTAASCFHWFDFEAGTKEIERLLKPGGVFAALWNPRHIEASPLLVEVENHMKEIAPEMRRVSSGRSEFTEKLFDRLCASRYFRDVIYLEGRHVQKMTPDQYIGAWLSVNDVQVQMGAEGFAKFMRFVERKVRSLSSIEAVYQTRAWLARRV